MIGLSAALAFTPPNAPAVDKFMESFSRKIERSFGEFDRAHSESLSKKQVRDIMKMAYQRIDLAASKAEEGNAYLQILLHGSAEEMQELRIDDVDQEQLIDIAQRLNVGIKRLKYAFFMASASPAWRPHMATLKHLEIKTLKAFSDYYNAVKGLTEILPNFIESDYPVGIQIDKIENALSEPMVEHPSWVNSGDDFVKWIKGMKG
ncbi:hypothetical protein G5574_03630 [Pantoea stewartii]|uniref:hypothetical protein n=1 Tax=Pantoea stewartii TaxID=66269 RepID=UPI0006A1300D|nr:hypothetical protein [Pantoea stewartii]KNA28280.1 hypothetical protein ACO03_04660 [Pantoea ananatis]QIE96115.1 hypothetical protein G5574_03630 [Pantoea stewartii]